MLVLCKRTYICNKTKNILYTNKKKYQSSMPDQLEGNLIYMWVLDNNNEWSFFNEKEFFKHFEKIETRRNNIIDELLNRQ